MWDRHTLLLDEGTAMAISIITTYEAAKRYGFSLGYVRYLLRNGKINGRQVEINRRSSIWLVEEKSLKKFLGRRKETKKKK
jgi:hypothetical protein